MGKKLCVYFILLCTIVLGGLFSLDAFSQIPPRELVAVSVENPVIIVRDDEFLFAGITQIAADEENIYVLFGSYSVVQVYSPDGNYKYSVAVYNHNNGRTRIAAKNGSLYICDKQDNLYQIQNGEFINFWPRENSREERNTLSLNSSDPAYEVRGASVWFKPDDGENRCVIDRSGWITICQGSISWSIRFVLMMVIGLVLTALKRKQAKTVA